jgi:hypothetical protein
MNIPLQKKDFSLIIRKVVKKALFLLLISCIVLTSCGSERYELVSSSINSNSNTFLVDKRTGMTWVFVEGHWLNLGSPVNEAPQKGDLTEKVK